jgi:hypothetical protein
MSIVSVCFAVINSCVYFVRRGLHISWYNLLSNPILLFMYNKILLNKLEIVCRNWSTFFVSCQIHIRGRLSDCEKAYHNPLGYLAVFDFPL